MATEKDLINAVRESLKSDGQLGRMKAEMCTEVIKLLDNSNKGNKSKTPRMPTDMLFTNELIREYLDWIGYKYSSTVFEAESELPKHPIDRSVLADHLGVKESENSQDVPLIFGLIETFRNLKNT
ncbi:centrosomal protein 20 [Prorops nasuta]|uniref:centrosomal protein 20 n=1 Tax=Prorops nasuta TaxID=863751 RepID=UPI0034CE4443